MISNVRLEALWNQNFTVESGLNYLALARAIEDETLEMTAKRLDTRGAELLAGDKDMQKAWPAIKRINNTYAASIRQLKDAT